MMQDWTGGAQSALEPVGEHAARVADLWWLMFWLGTIVFVAVIGALGAALLRRPSEGSAAADGDQATARSVAGAVGATALILVTVLVATFRVGRAGTPGTADGSLTIEVVGHQWWWEVRYLDRDGQRIFTTANEIHLPVGAPVRLTVTSSDVIHSFWVPPLHGKMDLLPDRSNVITVRAGRAGVYRGVCAEFCGLQHARMAFTVVALPADEFTAWYEAERQPAEAPRDARAALGRAVLETSTCASCHTVRGTAARGTAGPDLTHLARRRTLAAGAVPMDRSTLRTWIVHPDRIKPGTRMPPTRSLDPERLEALIHYLTSQD